MTIIKKYSEISESITWESTPCCIYNVEKAELIGIFRTVTEASKYIYGRPKENELSNVIKKKSKIRKTSNVLNLVLTARHANSTHIEKLGNAVWFVSPGYPEPRSLRFR